MLFTKCLRMRLAEGKMAAYLLCLTSGGGVPLFTRVKGDIKPVSYRYLNSVDIILHTGIVSSLFLAASLCIQLPNFVNISQLAIYLFPWSQKMST